MLDRLKLASTGFLQVFFVAANSYTIAHWMPAFMIASSFAISFIWSHNVKRIAFSTFWDRIAYSSGAALGCLAGAVVMKLLSGG